VNVLTVIEVARLRRPQSSSQQEQYFSKSSHCIFPLIGLAAARDLLPRA
jgi:hypothetical protein